MSPNLPRCRLLGQRCNLWLLDSIADHPEGTTETYACRATTSRHVFLEILQMRVILGENDQLPLGATRLARLAHRSLLTNQLGYWLLVAGNDDFLAWS